MEKEPGREIAIFNGALQLPAEQREVYLSVACAGDDALRQRVDQLLKAHDDAGSFLEEAVRRPAEPEAPQGPAGTLRVTPAPADKEGDRIGRYKVLQEIGEGGGGIVYMAQQEEPVRRRVALKVIKLGMDTRQVIARFEAERQALALMDHPNIAKVLDAGATDSGRPFFVMELVRGIKITDYCDQNKLSTAERLKLFVQVCHAIQHAHQKGIIHRDVKPSNILLTLHDGVPVPKVIDFGIAKATADVRLTDKTMYTRFEQFIGTPAYMSPEQAEMSGLDIDTRTDIYSLGVLLYELLTGRTPFDSKDLLQGGLEELRRTIREKEPLRPSTRISELAAEDQTTAAARRGLEAPKLVSLLRGDLDWIAMKALEKDRTRRYETANGLAMDVERYLKDEPVVARPPSRFYRFQKTVRRNKLTFAAAAAVTLALIVGLGASTWMFVREHQARRQQTQLRSEADRARANETTARHQAELDKQRAISEAAKSQQVAQFLQSMLKGVNPATAQGRDTTILRGILDETARKLETELKGQPLVEADLRRTLGGVYSAIGTYTNAEMMYTQAIRLYESFDAPEQQNALAATLNDFGQTLTLSRGRAQDALAVFTRALAQNKTIYGDAHTNVARSLHGLAVASWLLGDLVRAEATYREELEMLQRLVVETRPLVADALNDLALVLLDQGNPAEAEKLFRKGLAINQELFGENHPEVCISRGNVALTLWHQGALSEAERLGRLNLRFETNVFGATHPHLFMQLNNLALVLRDQGRLAEAEQTQRESLQFFEANNHFWLMGGRRNLSLVLRRLGAQSADLAKLKEALPLLPANPLTADAFITLVRKTSSTVVLAHKPPPHETLRFTYLWPGTNWMVPDFQDSAWPSAPVVRGSSTCFPRTPKTPIPIHTNLWIRREFELSSVPTGTLMLLVSPHHDAHVFINGVEAAPFVDWCDTEVLIPCAPAAQAALKTGRNVLALHCEDSQCGVPIEAGLYLVPDPSRGPKELLAELSRLVGRHPGRADLFAARGALFARLSQWNEAAADLATAVELDRGESAYAFQLGALLLQQGDLEGYRRLRQHALKQFAVPGTSVIAQQAAELALLASAENEELSAAVKLATHAAAANYVDWNLPWRQLTQGLADYRQGNLSNAIHWLNKALITGSQKAVPGWNHERERNRAAAARLILSMAYHRLGSVREARAQFQSATQIIQTQFPAPDTHDQGREWADALVARILLLEAKRIVEIEAAARQ